MGKKKAKKKMRKYTVGTWKGNKLLRTDKVRATSPEVAKKKVKLPKGRVHKVVSRG